MLHKDLIDSGLAQIFDISPITANEELAKYIGEIVEFKQPTCEVEYYKFEITSTQLNYRGEEILRGRCIDYNDTFGRPIRPEEVTIIVS